MTAQSERGRYLLEESSSRSSWNCVSKHARGGGSLGGYHQRSAAIGQAANRACVIIVLLTVRSEASPGRTLRAFTVGGRIGHSRINRRADTRLRRCFRSRAPAHVQRDVLRRVGRFGCPSRKLDRKPCGVRSARPMRFRTAPTVMSHIGWSLQAGEDQRSWSDPAPCGPLRRHAVPLSRPRTTAPDVVSLSSLPLAPSIHCLQDRSHSTARHELRRLGAAVRMVN
jgi:hypothetical protein